jgi:hypothetical protein
VPFFKRIERAQVDGDATSFIRFVWHLIQQSATDLLAKIKWTQRSSTVSKSFIDLLLFGSLSSCGAGQLGWRPIFQRPTPCRHLTLCAVRSAKATLSFAAR